MSECGGVRVGVRKGMRDGVREGLRKAAERTRMPEERQRSRADVASQAAHEPRRVEMSAPTCTSALKMVATLRGEGRGGEGMGIRW